MTALFPKMVPTTRSFTVGDYPSKTYRSLSGVIFKRAFGNRKTGYTLDMTFKNIGDVAELRKNAGFAKDIIDHYISVDGTFKSFKVPFAVFKGLYDGIGFSALRESAIDAAIKSPSDISWRYAEPPKVQSVKANMSTVTVKLIGELDA